MPWLTILLATATACLGSQASSIRTASNLLPAAPPAALICSIAVSAPALTISPYCATAPVIGPAMAIFTVSAWATPAKETADATAAAARAIFVKRFKDFIEFPPIYLFAMSDDSIQNSVEVMDTTPHVKEAWRHGAGV